LNALIKILNLKINSSSASILFIITYVVVKGTDWKGKNVSMWVNKNSLILKCKVKGHKMETFEDI